MKTRASVRLFGTRSWTLAALLAGLCSVAPETRGAFATFYVSPTGSDSNDGLSASTPFATIGRAKTAVAGIASGMTDDIVVYLRGGTYYQSTKLDFGVGDSGRAVGASIYRVIYQNYPGEEPTIIGGAPVTATWSAPDANGVYSAALPISGNVPYAILENNAPGQRARTPDNGRSILTSGQIVDPGYPYGIVDADLFLKGNSSGGATPSVRAKRISPVQSALGEIHHNDWVKYVNYDFRAAGAAKFRALVSVPTGEAGRQIEIRKNSSTGTLLGTLTLAGTYSSGTPVYEEQECTITNSTSGSSPNLFDVYLVFKDPGSSAAMWATTVDSFQFFASPTNDQIPFEAETWSAAGGTTTPTNNTSITTGSGLSRTVVASLNTGDHVKYTGVDFGSSSTKRRKIKLLISVPPGNSAMKLQFSIGALYPNAGSTSLGVVNLVETGSSAIFRNLELSTTATGVQDLYVQCFGGSIGSANDICFIDSIRVQPADIPEFYSFKYNPTDLPGISSSWATGSQVAVWSGLYYNHYFEDICTVSSIDTSNNIINLATPPRYAIQHVNDVGVDFYLTGNKAFINQPGEFAVESNTIYYKPRILPIDSQNVIVATTTCIFDLSGASHITFQGLNLSLSNFVETYRGSNLEAMIRATDATGISIRDCHLAHAGTNAISLLDGTFGTLIQDNLITKPGIMGIAAVGYSPSYPWPGDNPAFSSAADAYVNSMHDIVNNVINDAGSKIGSGHGINLINSGDAEISHNTIARAGRSGILYTSSWNYLLMHLPIFGSIVTTDNIANYLYSRNIRISYNDIFNCELKTNDSGMIQAAGTGTNNVIEYNRLHNSRPEVPYTHGAVGLYFDADTTDHTVENNLIHGLTSIVAAGTYPLELKGSSNTLRNNIVADNGNLSTAYLIHSPPLFPTKDYVLEGNILRNSIATDSVFYKFLAEAGVWWSDTTIASSDNNIFHQQSGSKFSSSALYLGTGTTDTWANWRAILSNKYDQNSEQGPTVFYKEQYPDNPAYYNSYRRYSGEEPTGFISLYPEIDKAGVDETFPRRRGYRFYEGFERTNDPFGWWSSVGTSARSTTEKNSDTYAFTLTADQNSISHTFPSNQRRFLSVWFYDPETPGQTAKVLAYAIGSKALGLGVDPSVSTTHYVFRNDTVTTATTVARGAGWHQMVFDFTSGTDVAVYIDGNLVGTSTATTYLIRITLGDIYADTKTGTGYYFDDVALSDFPPRPHLASFTEGFETGVLGWKANAGMLRTASERTHEGDASLGIVPFDNDNSPPYGVTERLSYELDMHYQFSFDHSRASIWFYDDTANTSLKTFALMERSTATPFVLGIGVDTTVSGGATRYAYCTAGGSVAPMAAPTRSTGWHEFRWHRAAGNYLLYVDDVLIATITADGFQRVRIKNEIAGITQSAAVYYDQLVIY